MCPSAIICRRMLSSEYIQSIINSNCSGERSSRYVCGKAMFANFWMVFKSSNVAFLISNIVFAYFVFKGAKIGKG